MPVIANSSSAAGAVSGWGSRFAAVINSTNQEDNPYNHQYDQADWDQPHKVVEEAYVIPLYAADSFTAINARVHDLYFHNQVPYYFDVFIQE